MDNLLFFINWALIDALCLYSFYNLYRFDKGFYKFSVSKLFIIGALLSTYCFAAADFYGYRMSLERLEKYFFTENFEEIYWILALHVDYDNILFRLVLSVIIFACYAIIIKKYAINKTITSYIAFIFLFYNTATILRSSVSDGIIFIGLLYFYQKRSLSSLLVFGLLFAAGTVLHKSAFMVLAMFLMSFLFKYRTIRIISLCMIPLGIVVIRMMIGFMFRTYFPESAYTELEIPDSRIGIAKIGFNLVFFFCFLITLLLKGKDLLKTNNKLIEGLYQYTFCTFILWIVFLFSGSARFVADRLLMHASIPMMLLLSYSYLLGNRSVRKTYNFYLVSWFFIVQISIFVVWLYHRDLLSANKYIGLL